MNANSKINYPFLDDCGDLLKFMYSTYSEPYTSYADFEGTEIKFDFAYWKPDLFIVTPLFPKTMFFIDTHVSERGTIGLGILVGSGTLDAFPCVELPAYVKDKLIATIKGE
jgi:hypothetical protein